MSFEIEFSCECGTQFTRESSGLGYDNHCEGGDDLCSCAGVTYYTNCPECGEECEEYEG